MPEPAIDYAALAKQFGGSLSAPPPAAPDDPMAQVRALASKGDIDGANKLFQSIPVEQRMKQHLYAGPGGGDATGSGTVALLSAGMAAPVVNSMIAKGLPLATRALATGKAAITAVAPVVKYEATKTLLEKIGVPSSLAIPTAMVVSGYKKGASAAAATEGEAATATKAATSPAASSPVAPAQSLPSPAAKTAAAPTATPAAVQDGLVVKTLIEQGGMTMSEAKQAAKWMRDGVPSETIWQRIEQARTLQKGSAFANLPTNEDVAKAVTDRNSTGRWPQDQ